MLVIGCSQPQSQYSPLSENELQKLQSFQLKHEFISGCVTDKLHVINQNYCDQESHYCNIPPESVLNYQQWLKIYQSCIAE